MNIVIIALMFGALGAVLATAAHRIEIRDEFEIEEFKKFSDVFKGRK